MTGAQVVEAVWLHLRGGGFFAALLAPALAAVAVDWAIRRHAR